MIDRFSLDPLRPERSMGRHVLDSQSPNSCLVPTSPYPARKGHSGSADVCFHRPLSVLTSPKPNSILPSVRPVNAGACRTMTPGSPASHEHPGVQPTLIVLEATGASSGPWSLPWLRLRLPVVVVNPPLGRDFAKATGQLAKTDVLDARALAHFAEAVRPTPRPLPDAQTDDLRALLARRRQLIAMRTAETNRLGLRPSPTGDLQAHIAWLDQRLATIDKDLDTTLRASPVWRERETLYRSVPGIGPVCPDTGARPARVGHPESPTHCGASRRGPLEPRQWHLAGPRTIWGGRAHVRATLCMGMLVASLRQSGAKAFYVRLCAAGKAKEAGLTACMRKLLTIPNAMGKHPTLATTEGSIAF